MAQQQQPATNPQYSSSSSSINERAIVSAANLSTYYLYDIIRRTHDIGVTAAMVNGERVSYTSFTLSLHTSTPQLNNLCMFRRHGYTAVVVQLSSTSTDVCFVIVVPVKLLVFRC